MLPSVALTLLGLVSASNAAVTKRSLSPDEVIVLGHDGSSQVMKVAEFDALENKPVAPAAAKGSSKLRRRACEKSSEVQVTSDKEFLNWDIAISPVVSSTGGTASVTVSSGYSLSNSVSVGTSFSASALEGILGMSLSVDYSETWSTSQDQSLTFQVPAGQHGVIVSQPYVRRVEGNYLDGCTDDWKKTSFVSDTYESQSYGNLQWVKGLIRLCNSTEYPIPYCNGEGSHK
ncbi:hypothetical protein CEP54_012159 [Fusarium duplospermum]|uniref:Celp0028 effector like protein n=1 Tax=Fusarium duplospermum TaxID=1325734 RepID=A0A428PAB0_9HYPO|nr:hypothetical protein CEP54_012159 [Fusarium duplospermum]